MTNFIKRLIIFLISSSGSDVFYDLPGTLSPRATSLGKGGRSDFAKASRSGSDNFYNLVKKKPNGPSFSFGISRKSYEKVFLESNKIKGLESPGPGKYSFKSTISGDKSPKYSIGIKFNNSGLTNRILDSPFLSTNKNATDMNPLGKFPISNCRNATNIVFGYSKEKRFNYKCNT